MRRIGVYVSWKAVDLVLVEGTKVLQEIHVARGADSPAAALRRVLGELPAERRETPVAMALSFADAACAMAFPFEKAASRSVATRLALLRLEECSAGETLEELSADVVLRGSQVLGVAVRNDVMRPLMDAAREAGYPLLLVTAGAAALALSLTADGTSVINRGGEVIEVARAGKEFSWRSYPSTEVGTSSEAAAELAVATIDPDQVPDALRGAPGVSRKLGARLRGSFLRLAWAASLLLVGTGFYLSALERKAGRELAEAEKAEAALFVKHLPEVPAKKAEFARAVRLRLKEVGAEGDLAAEWPSAFAFFTEIARRLPEPEPIGMTLEAIDLSPEGGRLTAALPLVQGDPLRNAALLETKLGESSKLGARGDYETRGNQVQVRLRLDFRKGSR